MKTNISKMNRKFTAMVNKSIELGFSTIIEAEKAGFSKQLKEAYNGQN